MRLFAILVLLAGFTPAQSYVNYESPQVHPIELSADGTRLFVLNTPDSRVGIYSLTDPRRPVLLQEVLVGLGPVSVRERTSREIWVVNYQSDSISIVDLIAGEVTAVLQVSDEPADVVFAQGKAFVSVSGSDEVRVFDATTRASLGTIPIFGDEPRNLVASSDGRTVWAVVHRSGNETTILKSSQAPAPPRPTNRRLPRAPQTSLIIDSEDPTYRGKHDVVLPDYDLFEIDTAQASIRRRYSAVGTINFGAAVRPGTDELWIANTEARNRVRFVTQLRGHAIDNRVTRVATGGASSVTPIDLNPGIDYTRLPNNAALSTALAQPTDVVWDRTGATLYVAAFGTDRIGMLDATGRVTGFVEVGDVTGAATEPRNKRGPRALAMHPSAGVLYILNRLSNSLSILDTARRAIVLELGLPDPTPTTIKVGRGFLYDAKLSGNGTFSCASCHVDGDVDGLSWDLGDPGGNMVRVNGFGGGIDLHPMKGPMATQSLKGLAGTAPFHWRGDKRGLVDFNETFDSLMGKTELAAADLDALVQFMRSIHYGSNPNRNLDDTLATQLARDGERVYLNTPFRNGIRCVTCHTIGTGTNGTIIPASLLGDTQGMKTSQLRNIYKRLDHRKTAQGRKAGFGMLHDGSDRDTFELLSKSVFGTFANNATIKTQLQAFVEAFDTGTSRTVGYQVRVDRGNIDAHAAEIATLLSRAEGGGCNLIVRGFVGGARRAYFYRAGTRDFAPDRAALPFTTWGSLAAEVRAGRARLLLMGVPPGSGIRMGIDRDGDGVLDGDEGAVVYGAGTAGCGGVPSLSASGEPRIGNAWFSLVARGAASGSSGYLGISGARGSLRLLGVEVLVDLTSGAVLLPVRADARGTVGLALPLPSQSSLVGLRTFQQSVWVDRCGPQGLSASRGLELTVSR